MKLPFAEIPITEIPFAKNIQLFIKREDLIHHEISGNKFWKLFYNVNEYLVKNVENPMVITFGGAFSNHISAVSAVGKEENIKTLGIIRGEELENKWQQNPTLRFAHENGMDFRFITRGDYRNKDFLTQNFQKEFPEALIIPEGGTNELAVKGVQHVLNNDTKSFDYLCTATGTGGTVAGISKFAEENQRVIAFTVVNDTSLNEKILKLSGRDNFKLVDASEGSYGKITDENIRFINNFSQKFGIALDPIYTGKMMMKLFEMIENDYFPENSRILAIHTGGIQGIEGANDMLRKQNRNLIKVINS